MMSETKKGEPTPDCDSLTETYRPMDALTRRTGRQRMWIDGFKMHFSDDNFQQNYQPRNKRMPLRDLHSENDEGLKRSLCLVNYKPGGKRNPSDVGLLLMRHGYLFQNTVNSKEVWVPAGRNCLHTEKKLKCSFSWNATNYAGDDGGKKTTF